MYAYTPDEKIKQLSFSTLADFKRLATAGRYLKGGYFGRDAHKTGSWRRILSTQTNGVRLMTGSSTSFLDFPKARDCVIQDNVLSIYEERVKFPESGVDIPACTYDRLLRTDYYERHKSDRVKRYRVLRAEYVLGEESER